MRKNSRLLVWAAALGGLYYVIQKQKEASAAVALPSATAPTTSVSPTAAPTTANMQALAGLGIGPFINRPYGNPYPPPRINPMAVRQFQAPRGLSFGQSRRPIF